MPTIGVICFFLSSRFLGAKKGDILAIHTPWTHRSGLSWERTHLLGYRVFKFLGFLAYSYALHRGMIKWTIAITQLQKTLQKSNV
jgi:hypothetical protein